MAIKVFRLFVDVQKAEALSGLQKSVWCKKENTFCERMKKLPGRK